MWTIGWSLEFLSNVLVLVAGWHWHDRNLIGEDVE